MGLPFSCTVEQVQLKNVTADVMNIIVTFTVRIKHAAECITWEGIFPSETLPVGAFGESLVLDVGVEN